MLTIGCTIVMSKPIISVRQTQMAKILMRAGKSPFEPISAIETIQRNLIGNNSGNLLFAQSVFKCLSRPDHHIDVNYYKVDPNSADYINENYDVFVLPLANAFRPSFQKQLDGLTILIRKLKIPVVVIGVGAQTDLDGALLSSP